jgi:hypothetical protein
MFLEELKVLQMVNNLLLLCYTAYYSAHKKKNATGLYPEPVQSSQHPHTLSIISTIIITVGLRLLRLQLLEMFHIFVCSYCKLAFDTPQYIAYRQTITIKF